MSRSQFPSLHVEGGLLPGGLFAHVLEDDSLEGRAAATYNLAPHESVREAASRAFDYLSNAWTAFQRELSKASEQGRPLGAVTRDRWLTTLFRALDYGIVRPTSTGGITVEDHSFPVSHCWEHVPIHLLSWGVDLDHRTKGVKGAAGAAPQSMLQELLNRSSGHLWAILSNGQMLRLLRDSRALAGSAYVEFDLELIFTDKLFSDFVLLVRLLHASRLSVRDGPEPHDCWLERWRAASIDRGERVWGALEAGLKKAIEALGSGFLRHPRNDRLRRELESGAFTIDDYRRALLRLAYRLLFLFVAENRDVLLDPTAPAPARQRYNQYFSAQRLRDRAAHRSSGHHDDLWESVRVVLSGLDSEQGRLEIALPGVGGLFMHPAHYEHVGFEELSLLERLDLPGGPRLRNEALLTAIHELSTFETGGRRRPVDFLHLDSEELGGIYERLLEYRALLDPQERRLTLVGSNGNERKFTGLYSTPRSLVEALLDSTLDPLLDEATTSTADPNHQVEALLSITVCDPACGSGAFLVAASRRIARRLAQIRSGEDQPSPTIVRNAMREVVSRCIHGVDISAMATELTKVSLWLESVAPGKPLAFLDANIRVGNSLLGVTPALLARGIPREALKPISGDDKRVAAALAKQNRFEQEHPDQAALLSMNEVVYGNSALAHATRELVRELPESRAALQSRRHQLFHIDMQRRAAKRIADAWCAAFVQEKTPDRRVTGITNGVLEWIAVGANDELQRKIVERVEEIDREYKFFHWHLEFPHIFSVSEDGHEVDERTGWRGGFTCVIGNPPWERIKLQEQEFFASVRADVANARNASARKRLIARLATSDDPVDRSLHARFLAAQRRAESISHLLRNSGRYPLTGRGDINTYSVFAEAARIIVAPHGRAGMVLPTGIATDATTQHFFKDMVTTKTLASIYDFENEEKIFPSIDHRVRFCLWTAAGTNSPQPEIRLAFRLRQPDQIHERRFTLTPDDIALLNPNTGTCPVFDYKHNAEITLAIYRHVPTVLWREEPQHNPWDMSFMAMFHMANDSGLFRDRDGLETDGWALDGNTFVRGEERMLPLYEAKMVHHFDHRYGTYEAQTQAQANVGTVPRLTPAQKDDPSHSALPRYWVPEPEVNKRLAHKSWDNGWLLGWRDVCRSSDTRTLLTGAIPRFAVGHKFLLVLSGSRAAALQANLSAYVLDFCVRQKMAGTSMSYMILKQIPALSPLEYEACCPWTPNKDLESWITARVLELTYTAYDMEPFARDHGDDGPPFRWDDDRRFWLRAELDAAYFHLYGVKRDDVDYIMDTFRAVRNNDPDRFARTKNAILEIYDAMAGAIRTGEAYRTVLEPPPGHGQRHAALPVPLPRASRSPTARRAVPDINGTSSPSGQLRVTGQRRGAQ